MEKQAEIYRELHGPHYEKLGYLSRWTGEEHSSLKNYEAALKAHQKELEIWTARNSRDLVPGAQRSIEEAYIDLAKTYLKMGDLEGAKSWFIAMEETAMKSKDHDENTLARLLSQQANALVEGGQPELALERLHRASRSGLLNSDLKEKMKAQVQALEGS
jgi:tetratricopeptide (TPR) repeat protein